MFDVGKGVERFASGMSPELSGVIMGKVPPMRFMSCTHLEKRPRVTSKRDKEIGQTSIQALDAGGGL